MPWTTSTRRSRLPSSWPRLRLIVLARDNYACQAKDSRGIKCLLPAREVDHKVPGDNHDLSNLQALCPWHHGRKSASEGVAARPPRPTRARPSSTNPAFL